MIITQGDLLELADRGKFDIIVQGCNCQHTMGSGIARQLRDKWPEVYEADLAMGGAPEDRLGQYSLATVFGSLGKFLVVNAYTQLHYLPRGIDHFEYEHFRSILSTLLVKYGNYDFGLPLIGCGLAGGDSKRILAILQAFSSEVSSRGGSVTIVEYK